MTSSVFKEKTRSSTVGFQRVASGTEGKMFERETWGRALTLHLQGRVIVHEAKNHDVPLIRICHVRT